MATRNISARHELRRRNVTRLPRGVIATKEFRAWAGRVYRLVKSNLLDSSFNSRVRPRARARTRYLHKPIIVSSHATGSRNLITRARSRCSFPALVHLFRLGYDFFDPKMAALEHLRDDPEAFARRVRHTYWAKFCLNKFDE